MTAKSAAQLLPHGLPRPSSLAVSPTKIADYHEPSGAMRDFAASTNHGQPGNPRKLAEVLVSFVDAPNPPVRLALGSDTVAKIEARNADGAAMLTEWRAVSISTDFAAKEAA